MRFKLLLLPVVAFIPAMSFAATYYVSPEGAGSKDGSSWENAFGVEDFRTQAAKNANGDVYNLAGGVYVLSGAIKFNKDTGFTLNGNESGERTVLSGDTNNNGSANEGDASGLIWASATTGHNVTTRPIVISDIDFTCVYTNTENENAEVGALFIDNSGSVEVNRCNFYKNRANGNRGGAAAFINRSTVLFKECVFRNNSTAHRGGAVRLQSENLSNRIKEYITFDRCCFSNNTVYGKMGGAIFAARCSQLNIINSTITGNKAQSDGAAIYINGKSSGEYLAMRLNVIGSTIAGNTSTGDAAGAEIASTQYANIGIVNSIIVGGEKTGSFAFSGDTEGENFSFVSGGWNYVGPVVDAVAEPKKILQWKTGAAKDGGDQYGEDCTYGTVFGDHTLGGNGVIKPFYFEYGATGAQTADAVSGWGIYHIADYNVDQLGNERVEGRMNGAYADPDINTGIDAVIDNGAVVKLVAAGNGVYNIEGHEGIAEAYSITGRRVAVTRENVISLEGMSAGMYIIKAGNSVFKVIKK